MQRTMCAAPGMPAQYEPMMSAAYEPAKYWPWPPMLNIPQRNANATARPHRISGVVIRRVCWKFDASAARSP